LVATNWTLKYAIENKCIKAITVGLISAQRIISEIIDSPNRMTALPDGIESREDRLFHYHERHLPRQSQIKENEQITKVRLIRLDNSI